MAVGRGVDFDDPDFGFKEEDKDFEKVDHPVRTCFHRADQLLLAYK